jgi:hypothetical protein
MPRGVATIPVGTGYHSKKGAQRGPGRPPGAISQATLEAKAFARRIVEEPEYFESLKRRAIDGKLPQSIEMLLLQYVYGTPIVHNRTEVTVTASDPSELAEMTDEQLEKRAELVAIALRSQREKERQAVAAKASEPASDTKYPVQ